ncbi:MAG: rod shape-determining protein MreC [Phycisphaerales bacterium]|nr:MAG: rod shape-determining protein MreC [Phycisphaerales bacterium]
MARKQTTLSRRMLFIWFTLGGFIFLFAPQSVTSKLQLAFAQTFSWPLSIGRSISLTARTPGTADVVSVTEYNKLQNHLANVTELLRQEHAKVEQLSGLRNRFPLDAARLVAADIITASMDGVSELIINRGSNDGLAKGQFILSDNGVVGTISEVTAYRAKAKLVTDPTSKIPVKITRLGVDRLMQGAGGNTAKILQLQREHKIKKGDIVYAGKRPGLLDSPMIVGTVARCIRDDENPILWDITVKPVCDMEGLEGVAVIVPSP